MSEGKCLCGSVTWAVTGEPYAAYNCHCKMCRKAHGAAFGTYWFLRPDHFCWTSARDSIVQYESSDFITRSACKDCGSAVPWRSRTVDAQVVPAGCHDQGRKADCEIFVADGAPWYELSSDLPRHDAYPAESGRPSVAEKPLDPAPDGVVRGSCLCGAVAFQVTEPIKVAHNCHCSRCRRARAAAHATNGFTSAQGVRFIKGQDHLKTYKPDGARYFTQVFCDACSAAMPRLDAERNIAVIPFGALDDDPGIKPADHIFVAYKAGWHDITDGLPQFEEGPPG